MGIALLVLALIVACVGLLALYIKGEQKSRDIDRLENRCKFLDDSWKESRDLVEKLRKEHTHKDTLLHSQNLDIAGLLDQLAGKDTRIAELSKPVVPSEVKFVEPKKPKAKEGKKPVKPRARKPKK